MSARPDINKLKKEAVCVRKDILTMLEAAGSGHPGGSLSCVELIMGLYYYKLKHDPKKPFLKNRDRFILSKGHGCPCLYTVLAHQGYFPREELLTLRKLGSKLQGHPDKSHLPILEATTGSLGQGLSIANGIALAAHLDRLGIRIYCLLGDGELNEGQIWEAMMTASHYKLDNLCAIVDYNKYQIDGPVKEVKNLEPLVKKWEAFNWHVIEINGHALEEIMDAYDEAEKIKGKPTVIIAHTTKGKGVSFMENSLDWHGVAPTKEHLEKACKELDEAGDELG
ncbi:MAG: transketolase [Candidatus Omnitrophota bacterium]